MTQMCHLNEEAPAERQLDEGRSSQHKGQAEMTDTIVPQDADEVGSVPCTEPLCSETEHDADYGWHVLRTADFNMNSVDGKHTVRLDVKVVRDTDVPGPWYIEMHERELYATPAQTDEVIRLLTVARDECAKANGGAS